MRRDRLRRSRPRSARSGNSRSTSSSSRPASSYRSPCMSSLTSRSRCSGSVGSTVWAMTRRRASRGIDVVATRMSSINGFSVRMPSRRTQRGVTSVIPCTTSTRPLAVASDSTRRPNSSKGVTSTTEPMPTTRRPVSATRCGIRSRSMPRSAGTRSVATTRRFDTMVRVRPSSQTRTGPTAGASGSASGSTTTPASIAKLPSSTRPSSSSTRSARVGTATQSERVPASEKRARRLRGGRDVTIRCMDGVLPARAAETMP